MQDFSTGLTIPTTISPEITLDQNVRNLNREYDDFKVARDILKDFKNSASEKADLGVKLLIPGLIIGLTSTVVLIAAGVFGSSIISSIGVSAFVGLMIAGTTVLGGSISLSYIGVKHLISYDYDTKKIDTFDNHFTTYAKDKEWGEDEARVNRNLIAKHISNYRNNEDNLEALLANADQKLDQKIEEITVLRDPLINQEILIGAYSEKLDPDICAHISNFTMALASNSEQS